MAVKYVLGVDPGEHGGLAILDSQKKLVLLQKMPTEDGINSPETDVCRIVKLIYDITFNPHLEVVAFLELVNISPLWGRKPCFTFGKHVEAINAWCKLTCVNREYVPPKLWQKEILPGVAYDKKVTIAWAKRAYGVDLSFKDREDGMADSLAICEYGWRKTFGTLNGGSKE